MLSRTLDIVLSLLALAVMGIPMLLIAWWVRRDSPGPALFRQERVGRGGTRFHILKFRSMRVDAPATGPQITAGADPRITRSGAIIRRWKLDELPQFLNVLRGDMALVGPRPEVPRYVAVYPPETRDIILSVRPGITDLASIIYRHESEVLGASSNPEGTYREEILPAKLALCEEYVRRRSIWLDLTILARTAWACVAR
jgi:lipopolysaccharide/colanic/teichoic acid biosynthesis glycosyltransferase